MPSKRYFTGQKIGPYDTLFLEEIGVNSHKQRVGIFKCSFCGALFKALVCRVGEGLTRSCGCERVKNAVTTGKARIIDLSGQHFGKLTALYLTNKRTRGGDTIWHCLCDCGNEHDVAAGDLKRGKVKSCGCLISIGEEKIQRILSELNIAFEVQKMFDDCVNPSTNRKLRFDFYLPEYNCCIEYDGIHHYQEVSIYKDNVEEVNQRDDAKTQYCKENNIKLIRISCFEFDKIDAQYISNLLTQSF